MAQCTKCGKSIHWVVLPNGTRVPLDAEAKVFEVKVARDGTVEVQPATLIESPHLKDSPNRTGYFVSHYAVCPAGANVTGQNANRDAANRKDGSFEENPEALAFCLRLFDSGIETDSQFERAFIAGMSEKNDKYDGKVKFSEKMLAVVDKLREKYEDDLADKAPSDGTARPSSSPAKAAKPSHTIDNGEDSIPF